MNSAMVSLNILNVGHTAYIAHLQQFPDFCPPLDFFRSTFLSYHNINLHCDTSILHHNGGLHKIWDGLIVILKQLKDLLRLIVHLLGIIIQNQISFG